MFTIFLLFVCFLKIIGRGHTSFINTKSLQTSSRLKRQSENHCILPDHPANGEIKLLGQEDPYFPNSEVVPNTIIDLSCANGTLAKTGGLSRAICYQGKWKPSISQMGCVRRCPQVQTEKENLSVTCTHKNPRINCNNPIEGTIIQIHCKPFYEYTGLQPIITCRDGTWDSEISNCQPECGRKRVSVQSLIIGGSTTVEYEYPWVAGIYKSKGAEFIGGATIISRHFVLSVAHHFISPDLIPWDINDYLVTAGKYYRTFNDKRDANMQSSQIKRLYVPETYQGAFQNDAGDLAILTLENPFTLTEYVQPICIDWINQHESSDLKEDNKGVITGWGYSIYGGYSEEKLKTLVIPYKSKGTCSIPLDFKRKFHTYDKFCAGYGDNHTRVCTGDSGGGLFFKNSDSRFYIRGILSVIPGVLRSCNTNNAALYTRISTYLQQIGKETGRLL